MEEKTREELEQEIAKTQEELDSKKAELDAVREQLGKQPVDEEAGVEDGVEPEEEMPEQEEQPEEEPEEEPTAEDEDLEAKEMALSEEVLILQARLVALQKNLNDVISNEAMAEASQEE